MTQSSGFTLIEALIVVIIMSVLAAIAYPAYTDYVIRSGLAEARTALADMRARMEHYFQDNRTFVGAPCTPPTGLSNRFTYSCTNLTAGTFGPPPTPPTYTIQAVGNGPVNGFTFTIDQANSRRTTQAPAGWGTAPIACWVVRKGGQCQ
ncbi:MAG TPA: type IV pilin protein [Gemmatimonadales bacterium]